MQALLAAAALAVALGGVGLFVGTANGLEKMGENAGKETPKAAAAVALVAALALGVFVYLRRKK